ncbi:GNAT family N-acetyltransferase [Gymnodinialimonas sp.]
MKAPERFQTGRLSALKIAQDDLPFVVKLMSDPAMHGHRPDPTPPTPEAIAETLAQDLRHWDTHGVGRWCVLADGAPLGLAGLTHRGGYPGLNISYHIAPGAWGHGYASEIAEGLVQLAEDHRLAAYLHGLVRPVNPASGRVLRKAGFRRVATLPHGGANTDVLTRALGGADEILFYGGAWKPLVTRRADGRLIYEVPVASGHADYRVEIPIAPRDLQALLTHPGRADQAYAQLHPKAQANRADIGALRDLLRHMIHGKR